MSTILAFLSRPFAPAILGSLLAFATVSLGAAALAPVDPDLMGVIGLATEEPVAKELQLTAEQQQKLGDLVRARQSESADLVAKLKDVPAAERTGRLEPFRRETESRGRLLLSVQQAERLEAIRLRRLGLAALAEPSIADRLKLDAKQRGDVANILKDRDQRVATADKAAVATLQAEADRALRGLLGEGQRVAWESLAAVNYPPLPAPAVSASASPSPTAAPPATAAAKPQAAVAPATTTQAVVTPATTTQAAVAPAATTTQAATTPAATTTQAAVAPAATVQPPAATAAIVPGKDAKLRFSFRFQPWKDVLDWFAQQAGLSLVMDAPPVGTFNYTDDRDYTPAEAIDLLNSVLLTKGYTLVRRERMLMLINLQDGIPPNLVPTVALDDLDKRGEFELVSVPFNIERLSPEEAEVEVKKLLGPQGSVVVLPSARQLLVTDTAGRLRSVRSVLERIEKPDGASSSQVRIFDLRHATSQNVLDVLRQLLDIPADKTAAADGSVRFAVDAANQRLLVSGKPDRIGRVADILKAIDVPESLAASGNALANSAQLEVYAITSADPDTVLNVLKTLLNGMPDVRLDVDAKNGTLIAMARPEQQATIRATLEQLQRDARRVEVIPLLHLDPQAAVASISRLFPTSSDSKGTAAPQVDADAATRQLLVRGTPSQIEQIHALLLKLGETPDQDGAGSTVRMLPLTGASARSALERLQEVWPTLHPNKIHVVTPSIGLPAVRPSSADASSAVDPNLLNFLMQQRAGGGAVHAVVVPDATVAPPRQPAGAGPAPQPAQTPAGASRGPTPAQGSSAPAPQGPPRTRDRSTLWSTVRVVAVADNNPAAGAAAATARADKPSVAPAPATSAPPQGAVAQQPAPIFVLPGPNGLIVASQDVQALNQFEQLLRTVSGNTSSSGNEYTIFYLKNAKADSVADTLERVFGSGAMPAGGGGADMMGGGGGGGDAGLGALMALSSSSGSVKITADSRLNALIVQASASDLDTVEQLLKVLDQKESPEDINVAAKPKIIQVFNTQASEVADIIRQVFQDHMGSGGNGPGGAAGAGGFGGRGGLMNPLAMLAMMRMGGGGGGGGRRGGAGGGGFGNMMGGMMGGGRNGRGGGAVEEVQKMSIGVDTRANSLIVVAPEPLFTEVRQLVEQVDQSAVDSKQTMQVYSLHGTNMSAVQQAVLALTGGVAQANMVSSNSSSPTSTQQSSNFGVLPGQHPPAPIASNSTGSATMGMGGMGGGGFGLQGGGMPTSSMGSRGLGTPGYGSGMGGAGMGAGRSMYGGAGQMGGMRPSTSMSNSSGAGMGGPGGGYGGGMGGGRGGMGGGAGGAGGMGGGSSMFGGGSAGGSRGTGSY